MQKIWLLAYFHSSFDTYGHCNVYNCVTRLLHQRWSHPVAATGWVAKVCSLPYLCCTCLSDLRNRSIAQCYRWIDRQRTSRCNRPIAHAQLSAPAEFDSFTIYLCVSAYAVLYFKNIHICSILGTFNMPRRWWLLLEIVHSNSWC